MKPSLMTQSHPESVVVAHIGSSQTTPGEQECWCEKTVDFEPRALKGRAAMPQMCTQCVCYRCRFRETKQLLVDTCNAWLCRTYLCQFHSVWSDGYSCEESLPCEGKLQAATILSVTFQWTRTKEVAFQQYIRTVLPMTTHSWYIADMPCVYTISPPSIHTKPKQQGG